MHPPEDSWVVNPLPSLELSVLSEGHRYPGQVLEIQPEDAAADDDVSVRNKLASVMIARTTSVPSKGWFDF